MACAGTKTGTERCAAPSAAGRLIAPNRRLPIPQGCGTEGDMIAKLCRRLVAIIFKPAPPVQPADPDAIRRAYERERKRVWRAKRDAAKSVPALSGTCPGPVPDLPKEREEEKRERGTRSRVPEDWRPGEEGMRIGGEVFGSWLENKITSHRAYWRMRDPPKNADWDAMWLAECDRCKRQQLQLPLGTPPMAIVGDHHAQASQGARAVDRARAVGRGPGRIVAEITRERAEQSRAARTARNSD